MSTQQTRTTIQEQFARQAVTLLQDDANVIGLAVAGSWLTGEIDEYSDLDLVLVTQENLGGHKDRMLDYARRLPHFISGFTGEHVGEPRLVICLYDAPLLHVDIKFVTLDGFRERIETPVLLLDKEGQLQRVLQETEPSFPYPDYQWIEDRFWTWVHYALLKIGRGEYIEAFDFMGYLRMVVFGPLLHIKNGNLPRGVRKVETQLNEEDLEQLRSTLPTCDRPSLLHSLEQSVALYRHLRIALFTTSVTLQTRAEEKVMGYLQHIKTQAGKENSANHSAQLSPSENL